jgi:DNA topoisomerase-2
MSEFITTISAEEHTRTKTMYAGSNDIITSKMLTYANGQFGYTKHKYIPSLLKAVDEAIVNVSDHFIGCINGDAMAENPQIARLYCDKVEIRLDSKGVIVISNNGYGIPIKEYRDGIMIPEALYTIQNTGTNLRENKFRITGGTNGCGAKIITTWSKKTKIECQDGKNYFSAIINTNAKGAKTVANRTVSPAKSAEQFTKLTFAPDWGCSAFRSYEPAQAGFIDWLYKRIVLLAMFVHKYRACAITYNGCAIRTTYSELAQSHDLVYWKVLQIRAREPKLLGRNHECFGINDLFIGISRFGSKSQQIHLSIVNGVEVLVNPVIKLILGKIFSKIKNDIIKEAKAQITYAQFEKYTMAIFNGVLMNVQWKGQTKEEIYDNEGILNGYELVGLDEIAKDICKIMLEFFTMKTIASQAANVKKIKIEKYRPSEYIHSGRTGSKFESHLWLAEGDSAAAMIRGGLANLTNKYSSKNSGILTLGGVIMNTYNRIKLQNLKNMVYVDNGKRPYALVMDEKCSENIFIQSFLQICGIKMDVNYVANPSESGEIGLDSLKYKTFIIATDQDLDGWNINGLLLVFFAKWPALLKTGRVRRFQTPIARYKPKDLTARNAAQSVEFFSQDELAAWEKLNKVRPGWEIKYYKGLGTTEPIYRTLMFANIDKYLYTFAWDNLCEATMQIYYDKENPDMRKKELSTPAGQMTLRECELYLAKRIAITTFLRIFVKAYQLDNLSRKLVKVLDGQNNVMGKLLYSYFRTFANNTSGQKVSIIGSRAIEMTGYHHGPTSIENSIINSAQTFTSKKLYPILEGLGEFGTRDKGGADHASSRYIFAKLNRQITDLIFHPEDRILLEMIYEEGEYIEPKYYYPIIPLAILENYKTTAHGWKIEIWGRDLRATIQAISNLINGKVQSHLGMSPLPMSGLITKSQIVSHDVLCENGNTIHKKYSVGSYEIAEYDKYDMITITELPLGIWNDSYREFIEHKAEKGKVLEKVIIGELYDASDFEKDEINIQIKLCKGWRELLPKKENAYFDDVILAFKLKVRICDSLNFIAPNGGVVSFATYEEFLVYWFALRKELYVARIARQIEILKNKILYHRNRARYIGEYGALGLSKRGLKSDEATAILKENGFAKMNVGLIEPRAEVPLCEICVRVVSEEFGASYEYLESIRSGHIRTEYIEPELAKVGTYESELAKLSTPNWWRNAWKAELKLLANTFLANQNK